MARPIGIDLFAGAGGMSLGFEQAGFDVVAAVDIDPVHCAVHKYNFPDCTVIARSIADLSAAEIRSRAGIGHRQVDCVFGGPPCQGFSLIGHRALDDPRNGLVMDFVRIVSELRAKTFVFENVKGLTVGKHRAFLNEVAHAFDRAGYDVQLPWAVLDAAHFGVPQHRERLILLGAKKGTRLPKYPDFKTRPCDDPEKLFNLPPGPSCRDALGDLPDIDRFTELKFADSIPFEKWTSMSAYAREMRCISRESWHKGYVRDWDPMLLTSSWRTEHTEISRRRFSQTQPGTVEPISRFYRLSSEGLSNTLRAGTDGLRGAFTSPRPIHYRFARCVSVREMARLHGFPDWFRVHATKWHGARQIGNAVAPPLARAIAEEVVLAVGMRSTKPQRIVKLAKEALLNFDASTAAEFFGIRPLPSKRDRKSGAKKRKQHEIEAERLSFLEATGG